MAEVASDVEGNGVKKVYLSPLVHLCASTAGQCHVRSYTPFLCPVPRSLSSAWLYLVQTVCQQMKASVGKCEVSCIGRNNFKLLAHIA